MSIAWNGNAFLRGIETEMERRLGVASEMVANQVRQNISTPTATAGPSRPGQFPHADTKELLESVYHSVDGDVGIIGAGFFGTAPYAGVVEKTRPFLVRTLDEMRPTIRRILTKPMPFQGASS